MVGETLGHYRILEKIGAGGMGEVYRARDTKLGREVAIKVLPEAFASDPERLARFEQEARVLAALNHPHIAAIHGLEEAHGTRFLVLELVPGQTLAEQLTRGPLPVEEALALCRQIAEALEAAHEKGIIHRDLKPANIKVTPEGKVKVLDFGLAKAFAGEAAAADISQSPTLSELATRAGIILGTAAYMSPEQVRGGKVDKRADIWAFGCVLFELLTGNQPFPATTVPDTLAAVLKTEPDWDALPANTPPNIQTLLRRCLQKDPQRRLRDIGDARIEINEALSALATAGVPTPATLRAPRAADWRRALLWALVGLLAVATVIANWQLQRAWRSAPSTVARVVIALPPGELLEADPSRPVLALSPDGTRLAYVANRGGRTQLHLRALDRFESLPIPGTEGGSGPFFSPDGQWLGFFADGKLKKVSLSGGSPVTLADAPEGRGASWDPADIIIFTPAPSPAGLNRVSAAGGPPQVIGSPDTSKGERSYRWPEILPGGKTVIFTVGVAGTYNDARIEALHLQTSERKILLEGGTSARFLPPGHLVYARGGSLLAVPFDPARLRVTGAPVQVLEGVATDPTTGVAHFSVSRNGSLVYIPGGTGQNERTLVWADRRGKEWPLTTTRRAYSEPRLSPDGRRLAVSIQATGDDVWIYEIPRATLTRLTFTPTLEYAPLWTPDGKRLVFSSTRPGPLNLFSMPADASAPEEQLTTGPEAQLANSWSPDGQVLAFRRIHPATGADIWLLPRTGDPRPFLATAFNEWGAQFSPDGRWLAYVSNEAGRNEVYVRPYPGPGGKVQISTEGGTEPLWAGDGRELFYRTGNKLMAVAITTRPSFKASTPRVLFEGNHLRAGILGLPNYDVAPDGQRFLMIKPTEQEAAPTQINVVLNWVAELKRRVPAK